MVGDPFYSKNSYEDDYLYKLYKMNVIDDKYYNKIKHNIYKKSFYKSADQNININCIGLSGNNIQLLISHKEIYIPIYSFLNRLIGKDIELYYNNNIALINTYIFSSDIYLLFEDNTELKISKNHILSKILNFNLETSKILLKPSIYTNSPNYEKEKLCAVCPISYNDILYPALCKYCKYAFEDIKRIHELNTCPICRKTNFIVSVRRKQSNIPSTVDIYCSRYISSKEMILIFYNLCITDVVSNILKNKIYKLIFKCFTTISKQEIFIFIKKKLDIIYNIDTT